MVLDEVPRERYPDFLKDALGVTDAPPIGEGPKASPEVEKWLADLDGPYQGRFKKEVQAPFENGVNELFKSYLVALDRELAAASQAARLDDALVWRKERQNFMANGQRVPLDDSDMPPPLIAPLRASLHQQFERLERERSDRARALFAQYDSVLNQYQALLTQRQRFDDAVLLKTKREELNKQWLSPSLSPGSPAAP
jgi:hypothetical protein